MLTVKELDWLCERAKKVEWDKNAFNCKKCPKFGCPAWTKITWTLTNKDTGKDYEKVLEGCQFVLQPIFISDIVETTYKNIDNKRIETEKIERLENSIKAGLITIMRTQKKLLDHSNNIIDENKKLLETKESQLIEGGKK